MALASHRTPKDSLLDAKTCVRPRFRRIAESRKCWTEARRLEGGAHEARRLFIGGQNGRPAIIASRGVRTSSRNWFLFGRAILSEHFSCFGNQIY